MIGYGRLRNKYGAGAHDARTFQKKRPLMLRGLDSLAEQCRRPHQHAQVRMHRFLMGSGIRTTVNCIGWLSTQHIKNWLTHRQFSANTHGLHRIHTHCVCPVRVPPPPCLARRPRHPEGPDTRVEWMTAQGIFKNCLVSSCLTSPTDSPGQGPNGGGLGVRLWARRAYLAAPGCPCCQPDQKEDERAGQC